MAIYRTLVVKFFYILHYLYIRVRKISGLYALHKQRLQQGFVFKDGAMSCGCKNTVSAFRDNHMLFHKLFNKGALLQFVLA